MYLDRILGSKTKINALATLVSNSDKKFLETELSSESGAANSEVNRQLDDLIKTGIILIERVGRSKLYQINKDHFLFKPLKNIFISLNVIYRKIADELTEFIVKKYNIKAAIIFGSLAKGSLREDLVDNPSDIDIVFICEEKVEEEIEKDLIKFISETIFKKYGITTYPILFSEEEYKEGLKDNSLIIKIHSTGEVIYGEKPRRTG